MALPSRHFQQAGARHSRALVRHVGATERETLKCLACLGRDVGGAAAHHDISDDGQAARHHHAHRIGVPRVQD